MTPSAAAPATGPAWQAAETAARQSYGRLLAWLACQWRDMAAAEDALATALEKALALWPTQGVPEAPDAWLLTVARRELLQAARRDRLHASPQVQALLDDEPAHDGAPALPDSRLKLLFVCAHPAINAAVRPALMLQAVLGLQAQQIAQAMLTSPAAMAQRLVRAKQKIRDAGLRFDEPGPDELPERLHAVLEAVYAAYGLGWDAIDSGDGGEGADAGVQGLRSEALFLADLVCSLLPATAHRAEAEGLLALILFCEARAPARRGPDGGFIALAEQDTARWHLDLVEQGNRVLAGAAAWAAPGPYSWRRPSSQLTASAGSRASPLGPVSSASISACWLPHPAWAQRWPMPWLAPRLAKCSGRWFCWRRWTRLAWPATNLSGWHRAMWRRLPDSLNKRGQRCNVRSG